VADATLTLHEPAATAPCALRATFCVDHAHPLLAGHFPGAPIVPGVLLLEAVRAAWERASGVPCGLCAIDDVRWLLPLAPGVAAELHAEVTTDEARVLVAGEWRTAAGRIATFRLQLAPRA
jgi:3-hydroxyacyl-[acyl-carrier-protein] dehydratase